MDNFRHSDGSQVAVTLVGNLNCRGGPLDAGGYCRRPAMGSLLHIAVEIFIGQDGMPTEATPTAFSQVQFINGLARGDG